MKRNGIISTMAVVLGFALLVSCSGSFKDQFKRWCKERHGEFQDLPELLCVIHTVPDHAKAKDKNGDGKLNPRGADNTWYVGDPGQNDDDEIAYYDRTGGRIQCAMVVADTQELCTYSGGTWTELNGRYQCSSSQWESVILAEDSNGDGIIQATEHWCEGKDENGGPNGQEAPCPYEGWDF